MTDLSGLHEYAYDSLDRLLSATHPAEGGLSGESYSYDSVGNRLSSHLSAGHRYDAANRLLEDDEFIYGYDQNGNLVRRVEKSTGGETRYSYDVEDQLIQVEFPNGAVVRYRYDGLGRRIEKEVDGKVTRYVYDGPEIALETDGQSRALARWVHGPGIDEPLMMERDLSGNQEFEENERFFYHADGLGSITALTDSAGRVVERYRYDSFGTPTILGSGQDGLMDTADDVTLTVSAYGNPFLFTGREWDAETSLYHYRARAYDPSTGRFLQEDPLGIADGLSLYSYVNNNPTNLIDPMGEDAILIIGAMLSLLGAFFVIKAGLGHFEELQQLQEIEINKLNLELLIAAGCDSEISRRARIEIERLDREADIIGIKGPFEASYPGAKGPKTSGRISDKALLKVLKRMGVLK